MKSYTLNDLALHSLNRLNDSASKMERLAARVMLAASKNKDNSDITTQASDLLLKAGALRFQLLEMLVVYSKNVVQREEPPKKDPLLN